MSNEPNPNAHNSTRSEVSNDSTALGPPTKESEETSWEMRRTVADERRQHLLRTLARHGKPLSVDELAGRLADLRSAGDSEEPKPVAIERERIRLSRVDLPQLNEAGFVAYDDEESTVALPDRCKKSFISEQADDD